MDKENSRYFFVFISILAIIVVLVGTYIFSGLSDILQCYTEAISQTIIHI